MCIKHAKHKGQRDDNSFFYYLTPSQAFCSMLYSVVLHKSTCFERVTENPKQNECLVHAVTQLLGIYAATENKMRVSEDSLISLPSYNHHHIQPRHHPQLWNDFMKQRNSYTGNTTVESIIRLFLTLQCQTGAEELSLVYGVPDLTFAPRNQRQTSAS